MIKKTTKNVEFSNFGVNYIRHILSAEIPWGSCIDGGTNKFTVIRGHTEKK